MTPKHPRLEALLNRIPDTWEAQDFILCGSACLALAGIRDVGDLDVMVRPALFDEAVALGSGYWDAPLDFPAKSKSNQSLGERAAEYRAAIQQATGQDLGRLECFQHYDFFTTHPPETIGITWELSRKHASLEDIGRRKVQVLHPRHVLAIKACAMRKNYDNDFQALAWLIRTWPRPPLPPPLLPEDIDVPGSSPF